MLNLKGLAPFHAFEKQNIQNHFVDFFMIDNNKLKEKWPDESLYPKMTLKNEINPLKISKFFLNNLGFQISTAFVRKMFATHPWTISRRVKEANFIVYK